MSDSKPKVLYHGSPERILGNIIEPRQATDTASPNNSQTGVYATERKDIAMGMSLRA